MSESQARRDHLLTCGPSGDPVKKENRLFRMMDMSLPLVFRVFRSLIPTIGVIILCTGLCRCFLHIRRRRQEQRQLAEVSARIQELPPSVYIIPFSPSEEQRSGLPHYGQAPEYAPPPPYSESMAKPDYTHDPPPAYTDSVSPPFVFSSPDRITPSCPQ